jgi:hypothetical protein
MVCRFPSSSSIGTVFSISVFRWVVCMSTPFSGVGCVRTPLSACGGLVFFPPATSKPAVQVSLMRHSSSRSMQACGLAAIGPVGWRVFLQVSAICMLLIVVFFVQLSHTTAHNKDACGNDAPLYWMLHQRGYDLCSLRKTESETQRKLRLAQEEIKALRRVMMTGASV